MNLSPLARVSAAASVAGTERAAATGIEKNAGGGSSKSPAADRSGEKTKPASPGDSTGDSAADGRQLPDTFERRHGGEASEVEAETCQQNVHQELDSTATPLACKNPLPAIPPLAHLDLHG